MTLLDNPGSGNQPLGQLAPTNPSAHNVGLVVLPRATSIVHVVGLFSPGADGFPVVGQYRSMGALPPAPIEHAGKVIREARLRQGLKQVDLQELSDVSVTSVVNVENGRLSVQLDKLQKLAAALGLRLYIGE